MDDESINETQLDADEAYMSPLGVVAVEAHEIYLELQQAGFPDAMTAQIMAHMLSDAVLYRDGGAGVLIDEDEDDDEDYEGEF